MAKNNPLFVDSTTIHGGRIGTQVELTDILLYDDERVSITIVTQQGESIQEQMEPQDDRSFYARVWLRHQEKITYQFAIESGERRVLQSPLYHGRVGHAIVEKWDPVMEETVQLSEIQIKLEKPDPNAWIDEAARKAESLIDKWDL